MTMKEKLKRMIDEKEAKLQELRDKAKKSENVEELRGLTEDVDAIIAELNNLKEMYAEADEPANGEGGEGAEGASEGARSGNLKQITETRGSNTDGKAEAEKRAKAFAASGEMNIVTEGNARAVLVSSGNIATPTKVSGIKDSFVTVSSIVDEVDVVDANGMSVDRVAYEKADGEAADTAEGVAAAESDPEYGYVDLKPTKVTIITYISEEVRDQSPLTYEDRVKKQALRALRAKASNKIVAKVKASELAAKHTVTTNKIDEYTLRDIVLAYGGDESVEGNGVLYLNRLDLMAFGKVRGTNEKKAIYKITPDASNPNVGTIEADGTIVKYSINKNCAALSTATAGSEPVKTMCYGNPKCVQLDLFSPYKVKVSEDYKFAEGMLAIRGSAQLDADLVVDKGFVVVELAANA